MLNCSDALSALWVMIMMMGDSLEMCVPSVGFGASFHFTNDLNFLDLYFHVFLSVSSQQLMCKDSSLCFERQK